MRRFALATTLSLALVTPISTPVFAQDAAYDASSVLAVVNGREITLGHLITMLPSLPEQYQSLPDDQLFPGMLSQLIDQAILSDSVEPDPAQDDLETRLTLEMQRRNFLANKVIEELRFLGVSDQIVEETYNTVYGGQAATSEFNAAHILVETEAEALALIETLAGGADFAELAMEKSTGPSGPTGGALGWFGPGQMVPEFENAVKDMAVGGVSPPVQTQFGWHVVKLNDKRDVPPPSLEEVREEITTPLLEANIREGLDLIRSEADVVQLDTKIPASAIRESELLYGQ